MYTDEPVPKKDVAPGQNFSRFNLLTKITVFPSLGYPNVDNSQDSWPALGAPDAHFVQRFTTGGRYSVSDLPKEAAFDDPKKQKLSGEEAWHLEQVHSALLIGAGPQVLPLHDRSVDRIQPRRPRSLDNALIATQIKFCDFQQATGSHRRANHQFE
jgi:hypothetical protein